MDKDKMLKQMCRVELNQADIKAICKLRALPPACLQSRTLLRHNFLNDTGIEKAVAALDPKGGSVSSSAQCRRPGRRYRVFYAPLQKSPSRFVSS